MTEQKAKQLGKKTNFLFETNLLFGINNQLKNVLLTTLMMDVHTNIFH